MMPRTRNIEPDFDEISGELLHNAAQASRLRRRGAIRSGSRTDLFIPGHTFGRDSADAVLVGALRGANDQRGMRWVICGGPEEDMSDVEDEDGADSPGPSPSSYSPSPLPTIIDLRPSRLRFGAALSKPPAAPRRISNGCGAILHYNALSVPRVLSCAARIDPDDEAATVGMLPESTHPVPRPTSMCGCARERVGCLQCGNEVGVRYRPCNRHAARVTRASVLFDPSHTHPDEPFLEAGSAPADADGEDSDSDAGSSTGLHSASVMNTLSLLLGQQQRQPLRSPPPVPTPLRAAASPMLALSELPWLLGESGGLPATGANATPLSPLSLTMALRRPLRDEGDSPSTPLDGDMADSDAGRSTPVPARRVRRKRSESIER